MDHGEEALGELVAPSGDRAHLLKPSDQPLDGVPALVGRPVEAGGDAMRANSSWRCGMTSSTPLAARNRRMRGAEYARSAASLSGARPRRRRGGASCRSRPGCGRGFGRRPFFRAPLRPGSRGRSWSRRARSSTPGCRPRPASAATGAGSSRTGPPWSRPGSGSGQSAKGRYRSGRSRQEAPEQSFQNIPSITVRWSRYRPPRPWEGIRSSISAHRPSESSCRFATGTRLPPIRQTLPKVNRGSG